MEVNLNHLKHDISKRNEFLSFICHMNQTHLYGSTKLLNQDVYNTSILFQLNIDVLVAYDESHQYFVLIAGEINKKESYQLNDHILKCIKQNDIFSKGAITLYIRTLPLPC